MWSAILKHKLDYKMPQMYFDASIEIFQNLKTQKPLIKAGKMDFIFIHFMYNLIGELSKKSH